MISESPIILETIGISRNLKQKMMLLTLFEGAVGAEDFPVFLTSNLPKEIVCLFGFWGLLRLNVSTWHTY
jgi:hypothetical protein